MFVNTVGVKGRVIETLLKCDPHFDSESVSGSWIKKEEAPIWFL